MPISSRPPNLDLPTKRSGVAHQLEREIADGLWPPGSRLPTEARLVERFGVGRQTVRLALADLAGRGLVKARQGVGCTVLRQAAVPEYAQSLESIRELVSYARNTTVQLVQMEERLLDAPLAALIGGDAGTAWCHALTLRFAAGQTAPMGLSSVWVPLASRRAMLASHRSGLPVFLEIQKARGRMIDKVHQVLDAHIARKEDVALLQSKAREPMLRIRRWYYAEDGSLLEMSDTLHPQSRFQYAMTLRHSAPGATPNVPRRSP